MTALWILLALGVIGGIVALVVVRSGDPATPHADLGTVSSQWISEQRFNQDSRR